MIFLIINLKIDFVIIIFIIFYIQNIWFQILYTYDNYFIIIILKNIKLLKNFNFFYYLIF